MQWLKRNRKVGVGDLGAFQAQAIDGKGVGAGLTAISGTADLIDQLKAKGEHDRANALETDTLNNIQSPEMRAVFVEKVRLLKNGGDPVGIPGVTTVAFKGDPEGVTLSVGTNDGDAKGTEASSSKSLQWDAEGLKAAGDAVPGIDSKPKVGLSEEEAARIAAEEKERQQAIHDIPFGTMTKPNLDLLYGELSTAHEGVTEVYKKMSKALDDPAKLNELIHGVEFISGYGALKKHLKK